MSACHLFTGYHMAGVLPVVNCSTLCSHIYGVSPLLGHQADSYHRCQNVTTVVSYNVSSFLAIGWFGVGFFLT